MNSAKAGDAQAALDGPQDGVDVVDRQDGLARPVLAAADRQQPVEVGHRRPGLVAVDDDLVLVEIVDRLAACRNS